MPSILSRLFLTKRKAADASHLLGGEKYEDVQQPSSPSAQDTSFQQDRPKSPTKPGRPFAVRKRVSSPASPPVKESAQLPPSLSLTLPDSELDDEKKSTGLGIAFDSITNGPPLLGDDVLASRMLSPSEALYLVQKAAESISEKGVETLGVMRPHWFSSSRHQEIQQKLLSRYVQVLSAQQANGAPSTGFSTSLTAAFESELRYTRDQHDVAAVLRWALRHLQLDGNRLGTTEDWYKLFSESEKTLSYPPKAFDDILTPLLPETHAQLVRVLLDLVSSLAAHSEQTGISGNKLSKVLAWWVVSSRNPSGNGFMAFYRQWEIAARQFEHMFLAFIRVQEVRSRMPRRLTELVKHYPFAKHRREDDGTLLPRPPLSTRKTPALLLRIEADKGANSIHPLRIIDEAFKASASNVPEGDLETLWRNVCDTVSKSTEVSEDSSAQSPLNLSLILADESIRLLSLVPSMDGTASPAVSLFPTLPADRFRRSLSNPERPQSTISAAATSERQATAPALSPTEPDAITDWQAFSTAGFQSPSGLSLAASLLDNDIEVTQPSAKKGIGVTKPNLSTRFGSASTAEPSPSLTAAPEASHSEAPVLDARPTKIVHSSLNLVQLDEAFIDFWADTLLDTIVTRTWPTFVVCQLKPVADLCLPGQDTDKPIEWLIIERVLAEPPLRSVPKAAESSSLVETVKLSTPTGNKGFKWSVKKRWSYFGSNPKSASTEGNLTNITASGKEKPPRAAGVKVGEMGEILREEEEPNPEENTEAPKAHANRVSQTEEKKLGGHIVNGGGQKAEANEPKSPVSPTDSAARKSLDAAAVAAAAGGPEVLASIVEDTPRDEAVLTTAGVTSTNERGVQDMEIEDVAVATKPSRPVVQGPEVDVPSVIAEERATVKEASGPATIVKEVPTAIADNVTAPTSGAAPADKEINAPAEVAPKPVTTLESSAVALEPMREVVKNDGIAAPIVLDHVDVSSTEINTVEPVVDEPLQTDQTSESKVSDSETVPALFERVAQEQEPLAHAPAGFAVLIAHEAEGHVMSELEPGAPGDIPELKIETVPVVEEKLESSPTPTPEPKPVELTPAESAPEYSTISKPEEDVLQSLDTSTDIPSDPESEGLNVSHVEQKPTVQPDAVIANDSDVLATSFTLELEPAREMSSGVEAITQELDTSAQPVEDSHTPDFVLSVQSSQLHKDPIPEIDQPSPLKEGHTSNGDEPSTNVATSKPDSSDHSAESVENHHIPTVNEMADAPHPVNLVPDELYHEQVVIEEQGAPAAS